MRGAVSIALAFNQVSKISKFMHIDLYVFQTYCILLDVSIWNFLCDIV
jgi:hypothetical protein